MSDAYTGEIRLFAGNYAPEGWALCDGRLLPIAEYDAAFALLGTTYGGDGSETFAVPDLRGRLPIGAGTGPGLSARNMGDKFGDETVALAAEHAPPHNHAFMVAGAAESKSPAGQVPGAVTGFNLYTDKNTSPATLAAGSVQNTGGNESHNNVMPSLPVTFIICLNGVFPRFD